MSLDAAAHRVRSFPAFSGIYSAFEPISLPLLRLTLGLLLMPHGCQKLFGWFGGAGFVKFHRLLRQDGLAPRRHVLWLRSLRSPNWSAAS